MISYTVIFASTYLGLYHALPIFQGSIYQDDLFAQTLRHLLLLYLASQFTNFLWRQKFVSTSTREDLKRVDYHRHGRLTTN